MIHEIHGNALDVKKGIIVHGCNCQGIMGGGIALEVKKRYPQAYEVYRGLYERLGLTLGEVQPVMVDLDLDTPKIIVNAMTQDKIGTHRRQVNYDAVAACFEQVAAWAEVYKHTYGPLDIIFPAIGAGLGGGNWNIIRTIIDETIPDDFRKILVTFDPFRDANEELQNL